MPCPSIRLGCACNLACTYCSVGADGPALVSEDELRAQIDGLRAGGYRGIGYMGGEPTVHPDFISVARYVASRGFKRQVLVTNGIRMGDPGFAARVVKAGVNVVIVSIDAFDRKVQERLYGKRGGYAEAVAGLHNVLAAPGVEVALSAVVTKLNAALLPRYMEEVTRLQRRYRKTVGVLLHALQQPAKHGEDQKAIALGMLDASKFFVKTLSRARKLGVPVLTFSVPPCLLPGHEQSVVELYAHEWVVDLATGVAERSAMRGAEAHWLACTSCPYAGHCPGVLSQYADASVRAFISSRGATSHAKKNR
jgi:sulfatase maturation enzyme AslB (radical SAM superfamily)